MSCSTTDTCPQNEGQGLGFFERYLTVWVGLCIVAGIALGKIAPGIATKNSAVNFLAGKGYDPDNFGKAPLPPFFSLLTARDFASHCVHPGRTS